MFNKIMKRGHRKVAKSDGTSVDYVCSPTGRSSGPVSTSNVVVNHASRGGLPPVSSQL